ncbi:hypothetical protein V8C37DRAFT_377055 [Trichoderma ceciliae]
MNLSSSQPSNPSLTPPCSPRAWTWKCHQCNRRYPLSCTRRCLQCSHALCFSHEDGKKKKKKREKKKSSCDTEFDFAGWQAYYEWRRELQGRNSSSRETQAGTAAETPRQDRTNLSETPDQRPEWLSMMLNNTHDCTIDCMYPSECFHKLRDLAEEPISKPSSTSSSSKLKRERGLKKTKKHKSRRRHLFQKQPSRLNPEWQAQKAS